MKKMLVIIPIIALLSSCSTPMRNYLEDPSKKPPVVDSAKTPGSDTISLNVKKKSLCGTFRSPGR
ncbi:MAG: hypothetical protein JW768_14085 [Chitinispirillaceae bacterium]|nr:hypothetical protein [Chitinispirillaceae bacterium]